MKTHRKIALAIIISICFVGQLWAQALTETVYLKNGTVVKGFITEWVPEKIIKVLGENNTIVVIKIKDIVKVERNIIKQQQDVSPLITDSLAKKDEAIEGGELISETKEEPDKQNKEMKQVEITTPAPSKVKMPRVSKIPSRRSPLAAFAMSAVIPGTGQFYNKQAGKGLLIMASNTIGVAGLVAGFATWELAYSYAGAGLFVATYLFSVIDAPLTAKNINEAYGLSFVIPGLDKTKFDVSPTFLSQYDSQGIRCAPGVSIRATF